MALNKKTNNNINKKNNTNANKDAKKKIASPNKNTPPRQRVDRPLSPSAAGRQQAAPSAQNKRQPVKPNPKQPPKNVPVKPASPGQPGVRPSVPPANKTPMPRNTAQNGLRTSSANTPAPTTNARPGNVPKPAPGSAPKAVKKPASNAAKKPAKKPAEKAPKRTKSSVRSKSTYHGGNYILYYMLAGVVAIIVLTILANTVLFRCNTISVSGNSRYSSEEIAERSKIEMGKNLLHINVRQAEENIVSSLAYIDAVKVKKSFPTSIDITVTEAEKWFCIRQGNTTAAVSYGGRIIEHSSPNGLTVITGYEPESVDIGAWLKSKTEGKNNIPEIILSAIEKASLENVDEVDLDDRFSIKMHIDGGRVNLELGTIADMESKLLVANELIRNKIAPSERGTVLLRNHEQATFIPEKAADEDELPDNPDDSDT